MVTVKQFITQNRNAAANLITQLLSAGVIMKDDEVSVTTTSTTYICRVRFCYTLTVNDFEQIKNVVSGLWWCIAPNYNGSGYLLCIHFKLSEI